MLEASEQASSEQARASTYISYHRFKKILNILSFFDKIYLSISGFDKYAEKLLTFN